MKHYTMLALRVWRAEENAMHIDEIEVYVTSDGLGRAAIVRRTDGLYCIYMHWRFPPEYIRVRTDSHASTSWMDDATPLSELYRDQEPTRSIFGTVEDARRNIRSLPEFAEAVLMPPRGEHE
jgi:hypothetical protein